MTNPFIDQARRVVAQAHAKTNASRLSLARRRCFKLAMVACFAAGLGWIGFGIQLLLTGSHKGAVVFAGVTATAIVVAWTAALCMSFSARPSLEVTR